MRSIQSGAHNHKLLSLWTPESPLRGAPGMGVGLMLSDSGL
jgi:hypothetical protein